MLESTLINTLVETNLMQTRGISEGTDRGKHVTSHRELIVFKNGILIDNPGMREVGATNDSDGLEMTFDHILSLTQNCKFNDCTDIIEIGCAILAVIENEGLDIDSYKNFVKMEKERNQFESDTKEREI